MNKFQQSERDKYGQAEISRSNSSRLPKTDSKIVQIQNSQNLNSEITAMDRENVYNWGA